MNPVEGQGNGAAVEEHLHAVLRVIDAHGLRAREIHMNTATQDIVVHLSVRDIVPADPQARTPAAMQPNRRSERSSEGAIRYSGGRSRMNGKQWGFWGAVIAAAIAGAATIAVPFITTGHAQHVGGIVKDATTGTPKPGVTVELQTDNGQRLKEDTTDREGNYGLDVPRSSSGLRLVVKADGYDPYDQKLPADTSRLDISLRSQPITFGIPADTPLDEALRIVANKLNVAIVFARNCTARTKSARLVSAEIQGDRKAPDKVIGAVTNSVNDNRFQYGLNPIEGGKRYEITCY
jgi:Carboxypeptidase regulatory-like domain